MTYIVPFTRPVKLTECGTKTHLYPADSLHLSPLHLMITPENTTKGLSPFARIFRVRNPYSDQPKQRKRGRYINCEDISQFRPNTGPTLSQCRDNLSSTQDQRWPSHTKKCKLDESVWPTLFLLDVFTALKGTHFYILFDTTCLLI